MNDLFQITGMSNSNDHNRNNSYQSDDSTNVEKWTCPACRIIYSNEIQFCRQCGSKKPMISSKVCQCGRSFKPGERFCRACGTRRPESEVNESPQVVCECGRVFQPGELFCPNCSKKKTDRPSTPVSVADKFVNHYQPADDPDTMNEPEKKEDRIESNTIEKLSSEMKQCPLCGLEVEESELFCPACGAKIRSNNKRPSSKTQAISRSNPLEDESEIQN